MSANSFRDPAPTCTQPKSFRFLYVGTLKTPQYMQFPFKMKRRFTNAFFMPIKSFASAPRRWRGCDNLDQPYPCVHWLRWGGIFEHLLLIVTWQTIIVDRVSRYNRVKKTQLDAQLILSIFPQSLHVSGLPRSIIRRYNRMHTTIDTFYSF